MSEIPNRESDAGPEPVTLSPQMERSKRDGWLADMSDLQLRIEETLDYATDALNAEPDEYDYATHAIKALGVAWYWAEKAERDVKGQCTAGHWVTSRSGSIVEELEMDQMALCQRCRTFGAIGEKMGRSRDR